MEYLNGSLLISMVKYWNRANGESLEVPPTPFGLRTERAYMRELAACHRKKSYVSFISGWFLVAWISQDSVEGSCHLVCQT